MHYLHKMGTVHTWNVVEVKMFKQSQFLCKSDYHHYNTHGRRSHFLVNSLKSWLDKVVYLFPARWATQQPSYHTYCNPLAQRSCTTQSKIDIYFESYNQLNLYKPNPFTLYIRHFPFIFKFNKPDVHFLTHS